MSETSYENVEPQEENNQVSTSEYAGEDEVVVNLGSGEDQPAEYEDEPPEKPPKYRPIWEDDGSDGAWVRHVIEDLLLWRDPLNSGAWLLLFSITFYLVKVSEISILTLVCGILVLQVLMVTAAIKSAPLLKSMNLLRPSFDPKTFTLQRQAFSQEELFRFSRGCAEVASSWILEWNDTLVTRNARKVVRVGGAFFALIVVGLILPFDIFLALVVILAFTLLKIYDLQRDRIDEILEILNERYEQKIAPRLQVLYPVLDSILYRLEPIIGHFDT